MATRTTPATMKAVVYHGANDLRVESTAIPSLEPHEVLVRVAACGIAPTDVKRVQLGLGTLHRVLGHEVAGTIVKIGADVDGWREGDRVVLHGTSSIPGAEPAGGGFAEFLKVAPDDAEEPGLVEIPRDVSFEEAIFLDPVNTCLRGIRLLDLDEDQVVLVAGVGSLGLILQQLAIREGARVVAADPLPGRRALAEDLGAERVVDPKTEDMHEVCKALNDGRGADAAIVAAIGAGPVRDAIRATRVRAKILLFGQIANGEETAVDIGDVCLDEKQLIGSYSWSSDEADEADEVVFRREIELARLITHRFPLEDAAKAFALAAQSREDVLKVVFIPGSGAPPACEGRRLERGGNESAVEWKARAGDPGSLGRAQEEDRRGDVLGRPEAARRGRGEDALQELRVREDRLGQLRPHVPGRDRVDRDPVRTPLAREILRQLDEAGLRGRVRRARRQRDEARDARHVDDAPEALRLHPGVHQPRPVKRRRQIEIEQHVPLVERVFLRRLPHVAARIVDEDLDGTRHLRPLGDGLGSALAIGHVERERRTLGAQRLDARRDPRETVLPAGHEKEASPSLRERHGDGFADAARSAGHDRGAAVEAGEGHAVLR